MSPYVDLQTDDRFASADARAKHDDALTAALQTVFATQTKLDWEHELCSEDVDCVEVTERSSAIVLRKDDCSKPGYRVESHRAMFDEHRRLAPLYTFSRSQTKADAGYIVGQHTDVVLSEIGVATREDRELAGARHSQLRLVPSSRLLRIRVHRSGVADIGVRREGTEFLLRGGT
jgi:crotonobetainyl-CoA:carnitine CoA-transferase CaiB-like acyl-CoA transferase